MIPPRSCRGGQLTSSVAGDDYPRLYGAGPGQRQHLEDESTRRILRIQHVTEDAMSAAVQEWAESGSMPESTS